MAPLVALKGKTLGEKHKSFNAVVDDAFKRTESYDIYKTAKETNGLDRLFKIDLAIKCKDVDYIIETLKCDDLLFVSRALKATWLTTDDKYAHIICPEHLYTVLFPQMYNKAACKLKYSLRQHLRNEERCQLFYEYNVRVLRDASEACHFLQYCSKEFIEVALDSEDITWSNFISKKQLKVICERFYEFAEMILKNAAKFFHDPEDEINDFVMCYINFNATIQTELYCDLVEKFATTCDSDHTFSRALSKILAQNYQPNIVNRYDVYLPKIYPEYIAKYWRIEDIVQLLDKAFEHNAIRQSWFNRTTLKRILKRQPAEDIDVMLDKYCPVSNDRPEKLYLYSSGRNAPKANAVNLHIWFKDLPFDTTFTEIRELIRGAHTPDDRFTLLKALAELAGNNEENMYKVLVNYYNSHVNEMRYYKLRFLNSLLDNYEVYKFSERCWKVVNDLFHSVEAYGECDYFIYNKTIIYYSILHDLPVPENIMEKYRQKDQSKANHGIKRLNKEEKLKIFNYLNTDFELRCETLRKTVQVDKNLINLTNFYIEFILRWDKDLADIPYLINIMKYIVKEKPGSVAYPKGRTARRLLFEESLLMSQDIAVVMNALKHDPGLIKQHYGMFDRIIKTKNIKRYKRFLGKIVLYFYELSDEFQTTFKNKLKDCEETSTEVGNITAGLSLLLKRNEFLSLIDKYKPTNHKINWSTEDIYLINIRKGFAQNLHMVRPHVDMRTIYDFAMGDYLQFAVPSLLSVCISLPVHLFAEQMPKLLNSPVSVQKHGIRLGYKKLKANVLKPILEKLWQKTRNVKIRCVIFQVTFNLLKEANEVELQGLCGLMKLFILNLKEEEDKVIFMTIFSKIDEIPKSIRWDIWTAFYEALKGASEKTDLSEVRILLLNSVCEWLSDDDIDIDLVGKVLLENLKLYLTGAEIQDYSLNESVISLFVKYLTSCTCEEDQKTRYKRVGEPTFSCMVEKWNHSLEKDWVIRHVFKILSGFCKKAANHFKSNRDAISDTYIYNSFRNQFEEVFGVQDNFDFYLQMNFLVFFEQSVHETELREESNEKYIKCGRHFSDKCGKFLLKLLNDNFPSVHPVFCSQLEHFVRTDMGMSYGMGLFYLTSMIDNLVSNARSMPENRLGLHFLFDRINFWLDPKGISDYHNAIILRIRKMRNSEIQFHLNRKLNGYQSSTYQALFLEAEDSSEDEESEVDDVDKETTEEREVEDADEETTEGSEVEDVDEEIEDKQPSPYSFCTIF